MAVQFSLIEFSLFRPVNIDQWGLYNLDIDPSETNDLAIDEPSKLAELIALYEAHAERVGILR